MMDIEKFVDELEELDELLKLQRYFDAVIINNVPQGPQSRHGYSRSSP